MAPKIGGRRILSLNILPYYCWINRSSTQVWANGKKVSIKFTGGHMATGKGIVSYCKTALANYKSAEEWVSLKKTPKQPASAPWERPLLSQELNSLNKWQELFTWQLLLGDLTAGHWKTQAYKAERDRRDHLMQTGGDAIALFFFCSCKLSSLLPPSSSLRCFTPSLLPSALHQCLHLPASAVSYNFTQFPSPPNPSAIQKLLRHQI